MRGTNAMKVKDLRIEYQENPLGLDVEKPRFSWKLISEEQNVLQTAYQINLLNGGEKIWDSGKIESSSSVLLEYGGPEID
jgi:alpha-L-rhamnosidase